MNSPSEVPTPGTPGADWFPDDPDSRNGLDWWVNHVAQAPESEARRSFHLLSEALEGSERKEADDWAELVQHAGEAILTAIADDFPDDLRQRETLNQEAYSAINGALAAKGIQVKLGFLSAGERFDPETMEAVRSRSASRFVVQQVHAWPIRDTSAQPARLMIRAKVTTA